MSSLVETDRAIRKILDLERRVARLEDEMDIERALVSETLKRHLNEEEKPLA